ncbi:hypothetical protein [Fontivita pretiosa]|uniref:hypothetical protein n=1 Tax=Fontivita pretiosa TaxID=2989684 RepID=UPI003D1643E0
MNEQQQQAKTFFARVSNWFRRGGGAGNGSTELPLAREGASQAIEPRSTFLRPWARQNAAIARLQEGFDTLTDLMATIRDTMERNARRQDELLSYLAHLPEALRAIPESNRIHGETLRAIHQQLAHQNTQQQKLGEILEKLSQSGGEQRETLEELRDRMESIRQTDEAISANMSNLGLALQSVSRNSSTSTQVLEQIRDHLDSRDGQLERILHKQNVRFTTMLAIAIFLSVAALVAVSVIGYLLILKK